MPWARAGAGFAETMGAFIVVLCSQMPVGAVVRMLGVFDDHVWRGLDFQVDAARARGGYIVVRLVSSD